MTATEGRRKKPPTFKHFPKTRAKKLKQAWIENKKIKRKWKAQKEREGWKGQRELLEDAELEEIGTSRLDSVASNAVSRKEPADGAKDIKQFAQSDHPGKELSGNKESIRQLMRQAYSPRALHSRKGDLSKRNQDTARTTKGQPDMKLRMNAILEKIKRDLS